MSALRKPKTWAKSLLFWLLALYACQVFAQAPTATTGAATGVGATQATLNGTVNANDHSTTVWFEYGLTTSYGSTFPADQSPVTGSSDTAVTATVPELSPNTTYHYRVVAQNANGTTNGADMTFTTGSLPPQVVTLAASVITATGATLNGAVNANGADAMVTFEYGTTTAYGTTVTADQSPVMAGNVSAVSKAISGLSNNTTYHYRAVATNSGGTTYGEDMTFTIGTVGTTPTATTDPATALGNAGATLNGTVNAGDSSTAVTFEYGLTTGYGSVAPAVQNPVTGNTDTPVSAVIGELLPNTTYHYRATAANANGSDTGADMTFTTLPLPPEVDTDAASSVGTTTATVNGTVNANSSSSTVTFEYGLTTAYGTTVTADQSPVTGSTDTAVSKGLSGLTNGTTYHYRAVAINAGGITYGEDNTFTTGVSPPTVATNAASGVGTTGATLNGTVNANGSSTAVTFEYGETTAYGRTANAVQSPVSGTSATAVSLVVADLTPGVTYHFRAVGQSLGGTAYGADMTFTTLAPPTVTTDAAAPVTTTTAQLNGTVNANGTSTTVTFEYGTTTGYGTTVTADQSPATGNADTAVSKAISGLTPGTVYHYRAVGVNAHGTTYGEDRTFITTVGPPVVTTNAATSVLANGATLNGTVTSNSASTTVTFEYGTTTAYGTTVTADQSPVNGLDVAVSKAITGLTSNTTYHYRVVGTNANGTTYGADMTFTTGELTPTAITQPATGVGASFATLNGIANGNLAGAVVTFEYGLTAAYGSSVSATPSSVPGDQNDYPVSAVLTGLLPNTTYHFRVVADNIWGPAVYGADMTFTTTIGPSAATDPATAVGTSGATLNGTVNANGTSTAVTFEYGLNTSFGQVVIADQSPVTGNTDTAVSSTLSGVLQPNTTYYYRAVASNPNDTSYGADITFTTGGLSPEVTTDAVTGVSNTGATLNGTVNARGDSTTVTFEYGLTQALGTMVTADQSPVTGNSNTPVSKVISGLTNNTTYHYRAVAQNAFGTVYGQILTFFTGGAAPTVTTEAATGIGPDTATLHGTVNANGNDATVTFEYGPDTNYGKTVSATPSPVTGTLDTPVSALITGLAAGATVHYRAVAVNSHGTVQGADMTFTTGTVPPVFSKAFSPNPATEVDLVTLTFTIDNAISALDATALDFTDNLPAGLSVANPANASDTCTGGTLTAVPGAAVVTYTGGSVAAGTVCTIQLDILASAPGDYVNLSGDLTSSSGNSGAATATLTIEPPPAFDKAFVPDVVPAGAVTSLVFTVDNTASTHAATGLAFTDNLPEGVPVADPLNATNTCGGTLDTTDSGVVSLSGGTVAAGATCTVSVDLRATLVGTHQNPPPGQPDVVLTSSAGTSPAPATATLAVTGFSAEDQDGDGVPDVVEDGAPNGGDGNNDGIPDRLQSNVASFQGANGEYLTLIASANTTLAEVALAPMPPLTALPRGFDYPWGFVHFEVLGLQPGGAVVVELLLHTDHVPVVYTKFGPEEGWLDDHAFEFGYDGTTGAQIAGARITLHFVDGLRGDAVLGTQDGKIVEPGAPGVRAGTGVKEVPSLSGRALLLLVMLLVLYGVYAHRRAEG